MTIALLTLDQLVGSAKEKATKTITTYAEGFAYHEDNLKDYFSAFGLSRYEDHTLNLEDILCYCEVKEVHPEWTEVLSWIKEFYIDVAFNYEAFTMEWSSERITEPTEQRIYHLITNQNLEQIEGIHMADVEFYQNHETLIKTILESISSELKELILYQIYPAISLALGEDIARLEQGEALFNEAGDFVKEVRC